MKNKVFCGNKKLFGDEAHCYEKKTILIYRSGQNVTCVANTTRANFSWSPPSSPFLSAWFPKAGPDVPKTLRFVELLLLPVFF